MRPRAPGATRRGAVLIAFGAGLLLLASPLPGSAKQVEVMATDDAVAPGTCPSSNSFGFPTGGNCFAPDVISVRVGDTVVWKSIGKRPHDVVADDDAFRSPYLYPGDEWTWTFNAEGEFPYYCSLHGDRGGVGHAGKVVVIPASAPEPPPPAPNQPAAGGGGAAPADPAAPGAPAPVVIESIRTRMDIDVRPVAEHLDEEPTAGGAGVSAFAGGVVLGLLALFGWRAATGGSET